MRSARDRRVAEGARGNGPAEEGKDKKKETHTR